AFPIMCADLAQVETICEVDETSRKIIQAFMPGPLTIILKKKAEVPSFVNGGLDTLAIRLATSKELHDLIQAVGEPLYMTSANQSGQPVCTSLDEIEKQCPLLDGMMEGSVSFGQASTIVDGTKADRPILRQGPLTKEQILNVLK
ncbi:MAG: L-threonylcarbamoyladenylate synthase, partial [Erysipelotrichaceae bacterium]|nr:L-threonylcarbamoyladenylate synthase [Erysipelotrichaceae bacterium]